MRHTSHHLWLLTALLVGLLASSAAPRRAAGMPASAQDAPSRAALVVQFADKTIETRCVSFVEPAITGADLLARSGLQAVVDYNAGLGGAVCSINAQGCSFPAENCFCRCQGADCEYWAYYYWENDGWHYSAVGASGRQVMNGDLEAWSWGPGNWVSGTEPARVTFDEVCAPAAPAAAGEAAAAPNRLAVAELLPGYAAYLLTVAGLAAAIVVVRRRGRAFTAAEDRRETD